MKKLYIYETKYSKTKEWANDKGSGVGLIKIGETTQEPHTRIMQQFSGYPCHDEKEPFTLLYTTDAVDNNGNEISDTLIHSYLENNGVYRVPGVEWFGCSLDEAINAINYVKEYGLKYNGNFNVVKLVEALTNYPNGLSKRELSKLLNTTPMNMGNILKQAERNGVKLRRRKGRDPELHIMVYVYTLGKSSKQRTKKYSYLSDRNDKFLQDNDLSIQDMIDIMDGRGFTESLAALSERLPLYKHSALEKLLMGVRESLIDAGLIVVQNRRYHRV